MRQRLITAIILIPIGIAAIYFGGLFYITLILILLGLAAWEFSTLFQAGNSQPSRTIIVSGSLAFALNQTIPYFTKSPDPNDASWLAALILLISISYHLIQFERGRDQAATDFAITVSGAFYIGFLGSYLLILRNLPDGIWWFMIALPAVWFADSGAYFYGRVYGRHKLSPRLSPKKTWEGYIAGVIVSIVGSALFAAMWRLPAGPEAGITPLRGAIIGLVISVITPLGDLGESMVKRQVGIKDSSNLIPGHGGAFDRIDSWLWAGVIGYYIISTFFV